MDTPDDTFFIISKKKVFLTNELLPVFAVNV